MQIERTGVSMINGIGLNFLTHDDLDTIHHGVCHILKHTGVLVEHEEAADRFQSVGAFVTRKGKNWIVKIPEWLVTESLSNTPKSVTYYARNPEKDFLLENNRVGFGTFGEQVNIIDPYTREYRKSTKQDCCKVYCLIDALDELAFCQRTLCPGDQLPATQAVHNFHALITHNSKHITIGMVNKPSVEVIVKMAAAATGGMEKLRERPICTCSCCVTSPLVLTERFCETLIAAVDSGINVDIMSMALAGGTGPVTLAGTIVQTVAEQLSGLILAQITRKGVNVTLGSCSTIMDLKTGLASTGAPEWGLVGAAMAKMGNYYHIPCRVGSGVSDSKLPDAQAAYQFTLNALPLSFAGANMVFGAGGIDSGLTFDYAKLIMDHECICHLRKMLESVYVNNETMALDLIHEIGPGGTFLDHRHTFERTRTQSAAWLFDRNTRDIWLDTTAGKDLTERAYAKAMEILENHQAAALPDGAPETINSLLDEFEARSKIDTRVQIAQC
jgi:trimethylamine--corrinoid protein Co-methyltransferase